MIPDKYNYPDDRKTTMKLFYGSIIAFLLVIVFIYIFYSLQTLLS